MSDGSIRIQTAIDNSGARDDLKELAELVDQYADKIDDKASIDIQKMCVEYKKLVDQQEQLNAKADIYRNRIKGMESQVAKLRVLGDTNNPLIQEYERLNIKLQEISNKSDTITQKIETMKTKSQYFVKTWKDANVELSNTPSKMEKFKGHVNRIVSLLQDGVVGGFKKAGSLVSSMGSKILNAVKNTVKLKDGFRKVNSSLGSGIGKIAKYALALFSIRSIYSGLSSLANTFLNSGTAQANQLKANIDYMKNALASSLAPAIEYLVNLASKLMSILNTVLTTLFGINLFSKSAASNMSDASNSVKEISKLSTSFDEMETLSSSSSSNSTNSSTATPNIEITQYEELSKKLEKFFDPIIKAWDEKGQFLIDNITYSFNSLKELFGAIGDSFNKIWQNGSGQTRIENIITLCGNLIGIIGDIASGFTDAWNEAEIGDAIMQDIFDIDNKILGVINDIVEKFREWVQGIDWTPLLKGIKSITGAFNEIIDCVIAGDWKGLGKFLSDTITGIIEDIIAWIEGIDWYQLGVDAANLVYDAICDTWDAIKEFLEEIDWEKLFKDLGTLCAEGLVAGLTAILSFLVQLWDDLWEDIKDYFGIHSPSTLFQYLGEMLLEGLKKGLEDLGEFFSEKFTDAWETIKEIFSIDNVKEHFDDVVDNIKKAFNSIPSWFKQKFTDAWEKVKSVFSDKGTIFSGIKEGISSVFKTVVNKLIDGINKIIAIPFNKINSMLNNIRSTNILGFQPFKSMWSYNPLAVPKIPKLAKGGIVNRATQVIVGEAGKEAVLPLENNTEWMQELAEIIGSVDNNEMIINLNVDGERLFKWFIKKQKQMQFVTNGG